MTFATAEDILPLDRVRFELRFPDGDTSQDDDLRALIKSAVSAVARDTNMPIPNRRAALTFQVSGSQAIAFRDPFFRSITSITYQAPTDDPIPLFFPDTVPAAGYSVVEDDGDIFVIAPAVSWPDTANRRFRVTGTYGLPSDYPSKSLLAAAAVLLVRDLYDGVRGLPKERAYDRIVGPLRNYGPWLFEAE